MGQLYAIPITESQHRVANLIWLLWLIHACYLKVLAFINDSNVGRLTCLCEFDNPDKLIIVIQYTGSGWSA